MSCSDPDDDEGDYELEPVDEHVVRQAENLAREELVQAERAVDVDRVYRELEGRTADDSDWEPGNFSFGIKHLLIATGVFGLLLGLGQTGIFSPHNFSVFVALSLVVLGAAHAFFDWRDRRLQDAILARQRYDRGRAMGEIGINVPPPKTSSTSLSNTWEDVQHDLREFCRFGIRELLIITAAVAVLMAIAGVITPGKTAVLAGMIALGGLGLQALDIELSRSMRIAWWASIFAYCALTVSAAIASALGFQ